MASKSTSRSQPINTTTQCNDTGFDFPLSPNEPGKFDFYRVHLNNQAHKNDSMFSDNYEPPHISTELPKRLTAFANMKHLSDQGKTSSSSALFCSTLQSSTDSDVSTIHNKTLNKPIQTVASFSSLADAVKNAMNRGHLNTTTDQLRRPVSGTTLSSKDLNHLSPQSM
ncbi:unnamed protein product [Rotaria socialis]|uniref:Uncharacterized protein n=1 Tax=Rotaria socialis TaxID=392032 RepID=A0A821LH86_9BILA|nr:unnamed protein product [Rotaria socialis]CAF3445756.1 unnamed protein product [Rotaria socialis]CAF3573690.1 unnamed protein product [Rotaria socialis]CAF4212738.1 unnamed protein product [Rotaria socialis]CAF4283894.1 unnamed protein product [Rotaria socialis]